MDWGKSLCVCVLQVTIELLRVRNLSWAPPLLRFCLLCLPQSRRTPPSLTQEAFVSPLAFSHHVRLQINQSKIRTSCTNISRISVLIGLYVNLIHYIGHYHHTAFSIRTITLDELESFLSFPFLFGFFFRRLNKHSQLLNGLFFKPGCNSRPHTSPHFMLFSSRPVEFEGRAFP